MHSYQSYGGVTPFPTNAIAVDFGPRRLGGDNYDWHSGIDYNSAQNDGNTDRGDLLLAVEGGTVSKYGIGNSGTKYIAIEGTTTNFVYVHIFVGGSIPPTE